MEFFLCILRILNIFLMLVLCQIHGLQIFFPASSLSLHFFSVFNGAKVFKFWRCPVSQFFLIWIMFLISNIKTLYTALHYKAFSLMFSSRSFAVLYLTFKSMLYFEGFFGISLIKYSLYWRSFYCAWTPLYPLSKLGWLCLCGCTSGLSSVLPCQYHIVFNYWSFTSIKIT